MRKLFMLGLVLIVMLRAVVAHAQDPPKPMYFDFTPLIGYRTSVTFLGPQEKDVSTPRLVLDPSPSFGFSIGGRPNDLDVIEFRWARQHTTMRLEQDFLTTFSQRAVLDQFHGDFTHEYVLDYWPTQVRPYIIGSVGATHVSGQLTRGFTRISIGLGAGVKVFATRHLGFRVQGEWLPLVISPEVGFICGGGCLVRISSQLVSQGEFTVGPLIRF